MRLEHLQKTLTTDGLLLENPVDLFYLTGLRLSCGALALTKERACLFVDGRYINAVQNAAIPVQRIETNPPQQFFEPGARVGFDSATMTVKRFHELKAPVEWVPIDEPLKWQRMVKDGAEIALMKAARTLCTEGIAFVVSQLKEGTTEQEMANAFDHFVRSRGAQKCGFDPIIAFGENSAFPHHRASQRTLQQNEIVLIDVGAQLNDYQSDMTRTVFFGRPDPKLQEIHDIVAEAQRRAWAIAKAGSLIAQLDHAARGFIEEKGYGPQFSHGLGHGIGLEVHEFPSLKNKDPFKDIPLRNGMCVTIEPGIYLEGLGGVRIEDTVIIGE